ncbi:MAG TPA: thiamine pyrophosphate-dependent dehydrogenase E1 component subunit alpha [Acidimicrobiia bacterium]|nr:thiamine pyrophosphate-dependent dehydrogenase E1 component subunit alpha [Acidimicrobiia bacterium]
MSDVSTVTAVDRDVLATMFHTMTTIRLAETEVVRMLSSGEAAFQYYPVQGQEAVSAGVGAALRPDDRLLITYRCLHDLVAKGVSLREVIAEMLGRASGTSKGKGGPMHISDPSTGLMVTTGVVGSHLPIANGLALAAQLEESDRVTVASFGDGATSIGACHEALNLAALWDLPVIFVCQNNGWAECTPFGAYSRTERLADRAAAYGLTGLTVDGNDPTAVYDAMRIAVDRARNGGGPTFLECLTYRLGGHYFGDPPEAYVPADDLAAARAADPVPAFRARLLDSGFDERTVAALEAEAAAAVDDAFTFARNSPLPDTTDLLTDVFASPQEVPQWQ